MTAVEQPCSGPRWGVKTLSDSDAGAVDLNPRPATVAWLLAQPPPEILPSDSRIADIELHTFVVRARLIDVDAEKDLDYHLLLGDLDDDTKRLIVEVPSGACPGAGSSGHAGEFEAVRRAVEDRYGPLLVQEPEQVQGEQIVTVTGVGFFEYRKLRNLRFLYRIRYRPTNFAPNGIELHPIFKIQFE